MSAAEKEKKAKTKGTSKSKKTAKAAETARKTKARGAKKPGRRKEKLLSITLTKSPVGYSYRQKRTVRALGLRRMHQTVEHKDTPVIRGMIAKVSHLVTMEEAS